MFWVLRKCLVVLWDEVISKGVSLINRVLERAGYSLAIATTRLIKDLRKWSSTTSTEIWRSVPKLALRMRRLASSAWKRRPSARIGKLAFSWFALFIAVLIAASSIVVHYERIGNAIGQWSPNLWPDIKLRSHPRPPENFDEFSERLHRLEEFTDIRLKEIKSRVEQVDRSLNDYVKNQISLETFLRQDSARLDNFMTSHADGTAKSLEEIKRDFANTLRDKISEIQKELENIRKQTGGQGARDYSTDEIEKMIHDALLKYYADVIGKTDYALYSSGARVIPQLTSNTLVQYPKHPLMRFLSQHTGLGATHGLHPEVVLDPNNAIGRCWSFQGSEAKLGIRLSKPIAVTEVTVEHVSKLIAWEIESAPRNITILGVDPVDVNGADKSEFILAKFEYKIHSDNPIQTFAVSTNQSSRIFRSVQVVIQSNWGHPNHTCLYRVRIHGTLPNTELVIGSGDY